MAEHPKPPVGTIAWVDLTVPDARGIRDFYQAVVGWKSENVSMGDYSDFNMVSPATGMPASGICHTRGVNADLPPYWLIYIIVENLDRSVDACRAGGGTVITGPKTMGTQGRYAVIHDPAGAPVALFESA